METIHGKMRLGDGTEAYSSIQKRIGGDPPDWYALVVAMVLAGAVIGYALGFPNHSMGLTIGAIGGFVLQQPLYRWLAMRSARKNFAERHTTDEVAFTVCCTPEALDYEFGYIRRLVRWPGITDLFWTNGYWIFIAQGSAFFVPSKAFADRAEEARFLKEALGYMNAKAREYSPQAVEFVERELK